MIPILIWFGAYWAGVSPLVLWDIARHQAERRRGVYDLPFCWKEVPWWWAADLFVGLTWAGNLLIALGVLL